MSKRTDEIKKITKKEIARNLRHIAYNIGKYDSPYHLIIYAQEFSRIAIQLLNLVNEEDKAETVKRIMVWEDGK
jgi:hypothetical protein